MSTDLITEHLDLWTSAVTYNNGKDRGNNGEPELIGIQKLRELILELAVRGKLVPQNPEDEPASKLLVRIEEEKWRLYKESKIKKPKKVQEINEEDKPFELPSGWEWVRLGIISEIERGGSPRPIKSYLTNKSDGYPGLNSCRSIRPFFPILDPDFTGLSPFRAPKLVGTRY